jgi:hypothetical protein
MLRLVEAYREAARHHGEATEAGNHKAANKAAERIAAIYSELRRRGRDALAKLLPLLADPAVGVRVWSAAHALEFAPELGVAVLEQLSSARGLAGVSAETTLKEWRGGRLRFP